MVEARRHFVVLLVRVTGLDGDRALFELGHVGQERGLVRFDVELLLVTQRFGEEPSDAETDHEIGNDVRFEEVVERDHDDLRNQGMNTFVVR